MKAHPDLRLFGPRQAIDSMPVDLTDTALTSRLRAVELEPGGEFSMDFGDIEVSAVRIPHAGWPTRHAEVENILFRVSLDKTTPANIPGVASQYPQELRGSKLFSVPGEEKRLPVNREAK